MPRPLAVLLAAFFAAPGLFAQQQFSDPDYAPPQTQVPPGFKQPATNDTPWILRWMLHNRPHGMIVNLPVIDTDPNRGTTIGVLPIWINTEENSERIVSMHAPSLTYNKIFQLIGTYRYYYYPDAKSSFIFRTSFSMRKEREFLVDFETPDYKDSGWDLSERFQYNVDRSNVFYGIGPATQPSGKSGYTENIIHNNFSIGHAIVPESKVRMHVSNHTAGELVYGVKIPGIVDITSLYPDNIAADYRQEVNETHLVIDYDTRDDPTTTTRGYYVQAYAGGAVQDFISEFGFTRYSLDARNFYQWPDHPKWTTASQFKYEEVFGNSIPFWLLPRMGGKYSLRAYGDGRFIDRGVITYNVEHRMIVHSEKMAGVNVDLEVAPFVGFGNVFHSLEKATTRYTRPVVGIATRAVARPQVVGSIDFGFGQEGMAAFIDINYSF